MTFNETFHWTFSGLNVNILRCRLDSVHITVQSCIWSNDSQSSNKATIPIHNSSFGSLDLEPGTKALITQCYIDAEFKDRPTLITANNSDVSIQNCQFENFTNENESTLLFGHNISQVTIQNSVFMKHKGSRGVLLLQENSSLHLSGSLMSQNFAFTLGYSAISLKDGIHAVLNNTVFRNNSALIGGAMYVEDHCQVRLANCTFSSNKAITGKTLTLRKNPNVQTPTNSNDENGTIAHWSPASFNQTWLLHQKPETLTRKKLNISKRSTRLHLHQNNIRTLMPISPALFNQTSSRLQTPEDIQAERINNYRKSTARPFDQNNTGIFTPNILLLSNQTSSATSEPERKAIYQTHHLINSSILRNTVQQEGYPPGIGGAVFVVTQSELLVTNCVFEGNSAQVAAGAIVAMQNVTLDIQGTTFVGNKALQGGAIEVVQQVHLRIKNCTTFVGNKVLSGDGGAITAQHNATLTVRETSFIGNDVSGAGGAITVNRASYLTTTNCVFDNNTSQYLGGAIIGYFNATLDIRGTRFTHNRALQGGAIDVDTDVHLRITDCTFVDNHAQYGGAIAGSVDVVLEIQETSFTRNRAQQGGAIDIDHHVYLRTTDCTFVDNHAEQLGGAIYGMSDAVLEIQETSFTRNSALQGGAINVQQVHLRVTDCTFVDNHVEQIGGAIVGGPDAVLQIQDTSFTRNSASQGGAINVQMQVNISLTNCRLDVNFASDHAAAILAMSNVTLEIRETSFTGNSASRAAGVLHVSQSRCHVVRSVFHSNTVKTVGGAVHVQSQSSLKIENTKFTNNNSSTGGAIHIESTSILQANMCFFGENFAKQSGGAIELDDFSTIAIKSCDFMANNARAGSGGAINLNNPEHVSIRDTLFLRNFASGDGGAVEISGGTNSVTIDNITCVGNHAARYGGCLDTNCVTLTLNNSEISKNAAGTGAGVDVFYSRIQVGYSP